MSSQHRPKVAGFNPVLSPPQQTSSAAEAAEASTGEPHEEGNSASATGSSSGTSPPGATREQLTAARDRLADQVAELTTLQEMTERLARTTVLDDALHETLRTGAALVGARRGVLALEPAEEGGATHTVTLGLAHADVGQLATVPRSSSAYGRLIDALDGHRQLPAGGGRLPPSSAADGSPGPGPGPGPEPGGEGDADAVPRPYAELAHPDIATDDTLDPRHREVAARLGYAASYAVLLGSADAPRIGAAVWLYDEPAEPTAHQRDLLARYLRAAADHIARHLELARNRADLATLRGELLPERLPRIPGVALARRHRTGPRGGGDWYDALPLPEGACGLAVGGVTGGGPGAVAAMGQLRAAMRAYAVMEGEDPVAVLSDLELLLRLTEQARSATALFAYVEPAVRRVLLAGAGHCPPLVVGPQRTEYVETTLSAPLGMLTCWEAPSVELTLRQGETLLLYTDGLLRRTDEDTDRAHARLHAAAASVPAAVRDAPEAPEPLVDHLLRTVLADDRAEEPDSPEDVVLLAARL